MDVEQSQRIFQLGREFGWSEAEIRLREATRMIAALVRALLATQQRRPRSRRELN
jgi:hypothetical protein